MRGEGAFRDPIGEHELHGGRPVVALQGDEIGVANFAEVVHLGLEFLRVFDAAEGFQLLDGDGEAVVKRGAVDGAQGASPHQAFFVYESLGARLPILEPRGERLVE